ncbi:MAG: LysE family transporter [Bdellovibrionales bacterium]
MIDIIVLFKILPIFFLGLISPGPDFVVVSSVSLDRGRIDGIISAAGVAAGMGVYALVSLTGMSALLAHYFWLVTAIKLCGGLYLLYLGFSMWRSSLGKMREEAKIAADVKKKNVFVMGALTNLTNPKVIIFFVSIFALILTPETNLATKVVVWAAIPLECFLWFSFVAFCLSRDAVRVRYLRWRRAIDRGIGTILAFFGLKLLLLARG